jgi:hypothetical protein
MSEQANKRSVAQSGVSLLKKLVLDNYQEPARERRGNERQSVMGEVHVTVLDESGRPSTNTRAFVRNSTRRGCGLWARVAMPVGRTVMLQGLAAEGSGTVQRMATVCHCRGASGTGYAIGVRFAADAGDVNAA